MGAALVYMPLLLTDSGCRSSAQLNESLSRTLRITSHTIYIFGNWSLASGLIMFDKQKTLGQMASFTGRLFARAVDRKVQPLGLSAGQLPVIAALSINSTMSQRDLVQAVAIEQSTMAATLARMERDGLITRRRDPDDRRATLITLTPKAVSRVPAVQEAIAAVNEAALKDVPLEDRDHLLAMLTTVAKSLASLTGEP